MRGHATSEIPIGRFGIDATKKFPGEGFKRPWPSLIKMDESSLLATLGCMPQSLWDWPDRGCDEAQPQHVRIPPTRRTNFKLSQLAHPLRLVLRTQSQSTSAARAPCYVELRNARLRLPAFGGRRRARDLWRDAVKCHAFSSRSRSASRGMRDRRTRTDGWFR